MIIKVFCVVIPFHFLLFNIYSALNNNPLYLEIYGTYHIDNSGWCPISEESENGVFDETLIMKSEYCHQEVLFTMREHWLGTEECWPIQTVPEESIHKIALDVFLLFNCCP